MQTRKNNINNKKYKTFYHRFYPTYAFEKVEDIPFSIFTNNHIKVIMFDMDNTLIDYSSRKYSKELKAWVKELKRKDVKVYILSNSLSYKTVSRVAKELGMQYTYNAKKPFLKGFEDIKNKEKISKNEMIMIGDQMFTDIWGGNRFGIKTILVSPIEKKERIHTRFKRPIERFVMRKYLKLKEEK